MPDEPGHTAVIALGGTALAPSGAHSTITDPFRHTRERLAPVVDLALDGWRLCIGHGDGPQAGDEVLRGGGATTP
jgi:carbamate kinase